MLALAETYSKAAQVHPQEREFLIDNLQVRIHFIIEMTLVDRPCVMRL